MKITYTNRMPIKWRIDEDGAMRITMCILKEGVFEYLPEEVPEQYGFNGYTVVREYIGTDAFTPEALHTLEGKSIVVDEHEWRTPENAFKDGLTVGAVAGMPTVFDGAVYCDAVVTDEDTIAKVQSGELVEVSAGYIGELIVEAGTFGDQPYDAKQINLHFNHILLLPSGAGRCGPDVRIINTKPEEQKMSEKKSVLRIKIGNQDRTFRFLNEEDREEAEKMLDEQKTFNMSELENEITARNEVAAERDGLMAKVQELEAKLAEHDEHLRQAKDELESVIGDEVQEALAEELGEQTADEEVIAENMANEGDEEAQDKEKFLNSIRFAKDGKRFSRHDRKANIVRHALKNVDTSKWTKEQFNAAYTTLVTGIKGVKQEKEVPNGTPTRVNNAAPMGTAKERLNRIVKSGTNKG